MKKYWASLGLAIAILCVALNSELWTSRYSWHIPAMPTILTWAALILGIPSGLFLLFCAWRFIVGFATPLADLEKMRIIVLWIGIFVFVLMGLFPPYLLGDRGAYPSIGFRFILNRAVSDEERAKMSRERTFDSLTTRIDVSQLLIQWGMLAVVTGGLIYTLKDKKKD